EWSRSSGPSEERDFPCDRISMHHLSGNHDRLSNSAPAVRRRVRELLGVEGDEPFPHVAQFSEPAALVRHGHEYDRNNFGGDTGKLKHIPLELPERWYAESPYGDFVTIDIAVRLPHLLRQAYGDEEVIKDPVLASLYLRLLEFDDVRPQSALLDFLLDTSSGRFSAEDIWDRLVPVISLLLDEIHDNRFFRRWLRRRAKPWAPVELDLVRWLLKMGAWHNRPVQELGRILGRFF